MISCRAVFPNEWPFERRMAMEWLENYRQFLNGLRMWCCRAAFDVGRFDHLRRIKGNGPFGGRFYNHNNQLRRQSQNKSQQTTNNSFPPNLWARCNFCNAALPLARLRRQEGIANSWLSRQKPVLTCCPQCKILSL